MTTYLRSLWMWLSTLVLIVLWLPLLSLIHLFDFNPARLRTGRWFRRLGAAIVRANPAWHIHISDIENMDPKTAYVVVSNHQSLVDIPLISCLPWEMKWIAKTELFRVPLVGWMMRLAGDIPLDRQNRGGVQALLRAKKYLQQGCPVMIFPEGTRSPDGEVHAFTDGAFRLAIKSQVPVLPLAVEGTHSCLQKGSWKFGEPRDVYLKVLPPVETSGLKAGDAENLRDGIRRTIASEVARWRNAE
jgi:1-acyl-sn-glycerol-3-phosphate acyltransferase